MEVGQDNNSCFVSVAIYLLVSIFLLLRITLSVLDTVSDSSFILLLLVSTGI